jgi:hypothetical protein
MDTCSLAGCKAEATGYTLAGKGWKHPLCVTHWGLLGEPEFEPDWAAMVELCEHRTWPRMFAYRRVDKTTASGTLALPDSERQA